MAIDVELGFGFLKNNHGMQGVTIVAPFYDETKHFEGAISARGLILGYTPVGTVARIISEQFAHHQLVQVVVADQALPEKGYIVDLGIKAFSNSIIYLDGALVYNTEAIRNGALVNGITLGGDAFLLVDADNASPKRIVSEFSELLQKRGNRNLLSLIEMMNIDGYIVTRHEGWMLFHRDTAVLKKCADEVLAASYQKLFTLNKLSFPESIRFPSIDEMFPEPHQSKDKLARLSIYFEEEEVVTYMISGKKWKSFTTLVGVGVPILKSESFWTRVHRWIIPEIVADRCYRRKNLFRFAVQYLLTTFYLIGLAIFITMLSENTLKSFPHIWFQVPAAILEFLSFLSLILSFSYGVRAVFGGRRLLRSGI